jgi:DMSO/TMAO reductase YedYZ molybdopterin-dependent catalytic subunit
MMLLLTLAVACQPAATPAPTEAPAADADFTLTVVGLDGTTKELSLAELQELSAYEGWGGSMSSTGRITPPATHTGVELQTLAEQVGGLEPGVGVRIVAEDGYAMTLSYEQIVNGEFITYDPGTGEETGTDEPLHTVLAYQREGEPLPEKEEGTLRLALLNNDQLQVTDGHWWVKWVDTVELKSLGADWTLHLEGAISEEMDRNTFESCASPSCHGANWTDERNQTWEGTPLWLMAGRVDNDNPHEGEAFDRALAEQGYAVHVVAGDGYSATVDIQAVAEDDAVLVAHRMNGNPLDEDDFPLRLVGDGLEKRQMVGQIAEIRVDFAAAGAEAPAEPTPEPTPATESEPLPACDALLGVAGAVETPACWTLEELRGLAVVEAEVEHPKNGPQTYEGVPFNAVLGAVQVDAGAGTLVLTASDGYSAELPLADVRDCDACLLAFNDEGGVDAVLSGFESMFWVKNTAQIEVW